LIRVVEPVALFSATLIRSGVSPSISGALAMPPASSARSPSIPLGDVDHGPLRVLVVTDHECRSEVGVEFREASGRG